MYLNNRFHKVIRCVANFWLTSLLAYIHIYMNFIWCGGGGEGDKLSQLNFTFSMREPLEKHWYWKKKASESAESK